MRDTVICQVCGGSIGLHFELFAAHLHTGFAGPAPDGLDLEAEWAKLRVWKGRVDTLRAQYYGLGPISWKPQG